MFCNKVYLQLSWFALWLWKSDQAFRQYRPRYAGSFPVPVVMGIERHAVFVPSWSLAENLPRSLLRVAAPAHRLEVRSIKE